MGIKYSKNGSKSRVEFEFNADRILQPTFPASLVGIFSGAVAYANAPRPQMDTVDSLTLGIIVTVATFLAAKTGKKIGAYIGEKAGFILGGTTGATTGATFGVLSKNSSDDKAKMAGAGAALGGFAGGLFGAAALGMIGYVCGFAGGAYAGHVYSKEASMKYIFNKPAAAQMQVISLPRQDVPAMIAAFKPR